MDKILAKIGMRDDVFADLKANGASAESFQPECERLHFDPLLTAIVGLPFMVYIEDLITNDERYALDCQLKENWDIRIRKERA